MNITKDDIKEYLRGFGCLTIILIVLAVLLIILPLVLFLGACLWGGVAYLLWNFVLVPVCGIAVINFWWQSWIVGLVFMLVISALKSVFKPGKG
jgi:hypothetical protein